MALMATGLLAGALSAAAINDDQRTLGKTEAERIIATFTGGQLPVSVDLDLEQATDGKDRFSYSYTDGALTIHASSGVAACRAFYDFTKANGAGMMSWSGSRFSLPATLSKTEQTTITSPYRDHQYFNVVTYGYSTPYWDTERWDREIDWMALHGIDMPLMLVGAEGIYFDTFTKDFNIPAADVHAWEVGPAHLPWMRMGNLAGSQFDGPLDEHWYSQQKALAHHILKRMYALGMKPICPAFGGFVPATFAKYNSGATLQNTGWDWVISRGENNQRLNPDSKQFVEVGSKFIERWEEEFTSSYPGLKYYLSDSFNEMKVPDATATLKTYGDNIYASIRDAAKTYNPDADRVWVTQGWEFIYGAGKWSDAKFKALTGGVPDHNFMVLSMSPEYGGYGNRGWEWYSNYNGKEWCNTMLPNMGGKNFWTGCLNDYANTFPKALAASTGRKNNTGWGMTMEGIEYNEMLYELIADMGWTDPAKGRNLASWIAEYGKARYGNYTDDLKAMHKTLQDNVYAKYRDHQTFGWQGYNRSSGYYTPGNIDYITPTYYTGLEDFFSADNVERLRQQPMPATLRADVIELAAFYAAARVEKINQRITTEKVAGNIDKANDIVADLQRVMLDMDRLLTAHPIYDLQKWEDKARRAAGGDAKRERQYVRDARSIVSTWHSAHGSGPGAHEPVNDYAGRIWAGLIRGYYWPRLQADLDNYLNGKSNNLRTIENNFVNTSTSIALPPVQAVVDGKVTDVDGFTPDTPDAVILDFARQLVEEAREAGDFDYEKLAYTASTDAENHWFVIRSANPDKISQVLTTTGPSTTTTAGLGAAMLSGETGQYWRIIDNGDNTFRLENRDGQSMAYDGGFKALQPALNTDVVLQFDQTNMRYALVFKKAPSGNQAISLSANGITNAAYKSGTKYLDASCWTLESADAKIELSNAADYKRLLRRLHGFEPQHYGITSLYGKPGQPVSEAALLRAIATMSTDRAPLETYTQLLEQKWAPAWADAIVQPTTAKGRKLLDLIVTTFQIDTSAADPTALRSALIVAQQALADEEGATQTQLNSAITALQKAVKAYLDTLPSLPFASQTPVDGKFHYASQAVTLRLKSTGYLTTANVDGSGYLKVNKTAEPTDARGYWVISGTDAEGYSFYNVKEGARKVLGFTGSEGDARAKLYSVASLPAQVTTRFQYATNSLGEPIFVISDNNAWNDYGNRGYLSLWNHANVRGSGCPGSALIISPVESVDLGATYGEPSLDGIAPLTTSPFTLSPLPVYDLQGRLFTRLQRGITIEGGRTVVR